MVLFYLGITLIIVGVAFHFATRKYINRYKLYMVFGKKGSGKSTLMTRLALDHLGKGWRVYCTEPLNIPGVRLFNVDNIGKRTFEEDSLVLVDEVGMIWDNRNFKDFAVEVRDWFKLQRHYKCKVYLFSQSFDIDKKLRDLTDGLYLCNTVLRVFTWAKRIHRSVVLTQAESDRESRISENLEFDSLLMWPFGARILTYIPKYAPYFDSHAVPKMHPMPYKDMIGLPADPEPKVLFCCVQFIQDKWIQAKGLLLSLIRRLRRRGKFERDE